jgi:hypothetical protein
MFNPNKDTKTHDTKNMFNSSIKKLKRNEDLAFLGVGIRPKEPMKLEHLKTKFNVGYQLVSFS